MMSFLADLRSMLSTVEPGADFDGTSFDEGVEIVTRWSRDEIVRDVRDGTVPANVHDFASLHDYVDANLYGGAAFWPSLPSDSDDEQYQNEFCRFWNIVQERLDAWIKANGIQLSQSQTRSSLGHLIRHDGSDKDAERSKNGY